MRHARILLAGHCIAGALLAGQGVAADEVTALPDWFEGNRVQAHFENGIQDDLNGMYRDLHGAIHAMGARVLTRIFKTTGEGAWWPTAVGPSYETLAGRDLGREIADDARARGLKVFAYYRVMCDDFIEAEHPGWLCRDGAGNLVVEPRTRKRAKPMHVICLNSPAREYTRKRLLELADRGVDGIYFDSWHMPEVCACPHCRLAFEKETGEPMDASAGRGSEAYRRMAAFVGRTIVRTFSEWKAAVKEKHPGVLFAIGSSLYPCFDTQMQITPALLDISDTSKTEFSKPFGGHLRAPAAGGVEAGKGKQAFMDETFAIPEYDVQNALGWIHTRDSCDGRPPLMWIPFTRTEEEAFFSVVASVAYGCIASLHPEGLREPRSTVIRGDALRTYEPCYQFGAKVSPVLAAARPLREVLIHVSARSRDARIADPRGLWVECMAPILGAFEALKEEHVPVATINDLQLGRGVPAECRVLVLPDPGACGEAEAGAVTRFEATGGRVIRLDPGAGWHLKGEKDGLKREMIGKLWPSGQGPSIRVRGPAGMHAVFYREPRSGRTIVCLVNAFGWFRSSGPGSPTPGTTGKPAPCAGVSIEMTGVREGGASAVEVVTGRALPIKSGEGKTTVGVPDFSVAGCVVIEGAALTTPGR